MPVRATAELSFNPEPAATAGAGGSRLPTAVGRALAQQSAVVPLPAVAVGSGLNYQRRASKRARARGQSPSASIKSGAKGDLSRAGAATAARTRMRPYANGSSYSPWLARLSLPCRANSSQTASGYWSGGVMATIPDGRPLLIGPTPIRD